MCNSDQQIFSSKSTQSHTRAKLSDEEFSAIVEANEPLIVLLKYTFACNTMLSHDSIDARLSGVRLITTIVKTDVVISNLSNLVAVEIHSRLVSVSIIGDTSVVQLPVLVVRNGGIHESLDLTHDLAWFV